jgi:hypothetical protein
MQKDRDAHCQKQNQKQPTQPRAGARWEQRWATLQASVDQLDSNLGRQLCRLNLTNAPDPKWEHLSSTSKTWRSEMCRFHVTPEDGQETFAAI